MVQLIVVVAIAGVIYASVIVAARRCWQKRYGPVVADKPAPQRRLRKCFLTVTILYGVLCGSLYFPLLGTIMGGLTALLVAFLYLRALDAFAGWLGSV